MSALHFSLIDDYKEQTRKGTRVTVWSAEREGEGGRMKGKDSSILLQMCDSEGQLNLFIYFDTTSVTIGFFLIIVIYRDDN